MASDSRLPLCVFAKPPLFGSRLKESGLSAAQRLLSRHSHLSSSEILCYTTYNYNIVHVFICFPHIYCNIALCYPIAITAYT